MSAKGKYSPAVVEAIQSAIQKTGRDKDGIRAGGISKKTFYEWLNKKSDFSNVIAQAKVQFRNTQWSNDPEILDKAVQSFKKAIDGNNETWLTEKIEEIIDPKDSTKKSLIKKTTTKHAVKRSGQPWAINLMLNPGGSIKGLGRKDMIGGDEDRKKLEDWINDNTYE